MNTSIMEELHDKGFSFEQIMIVVEIIDRLEAARRAVAVERTRAWRARQNEKGATPAGQKQNGID